MLREYLGPLRWQVMALAALLLTGTGLNLLLPQLLARFVDGVKLGAGADVGLLMRLAGAYIALGLGVQLLTAGATYLGAQVGWAATNRLRADLMRHMLSLDLREHQERTPGEMIERIDGDVTALSNFFSQFAVRVFGAALLLVGALVMFFLEDWRVGLGVSLFALVTLLALNRTRRAGIEPTRLERESSARLFGYVEERLAGLEDVRALGAGEHHLRGFLRVQREFFQRSIGSWLRRSIVWQISMALFAAGYVGVLGAAVGLYAAGAITLGTAFLFYQYMSMVEEPIDQLTQQLQDLQKAGASLVRVGELLKLRSALQGARATCPRPPRPDLRGRDLQLCPRGPHCPARVGGRELPPSRRADPRPAGAHRERQDEPDAAGLAAVRSQRGACASGRPRHPRGAAGEPADPRRRRHPGRAALPGQRARQPELLRPGGARRAGRGCAARGGAGLLARPPLRWRPHPLPTGSLSAGQAQLLAFARVMLRNPAVIILDEPSSRLDPATETQLTRAMTRLLAGRTAIVIAHRLETVARADRILVLGEGRVLEDGPRADLARDPGSHYAGLLRVGLEGDGAEVVGEGVLA